MTRKDSPNTKDKVKKLGIRRQTVKDLEPKTSAAEKVKGGPASKYGGGMTV